MKGVKKLVLVYSKPQCSQCESTKRKLENLSVEFEEKSLYDSPEIVEEAKSRGIYSAPIVIADKEWWGGHNNMKLDSLAVNNNNDVWDY